MSAPWQLSAVRLVHWHNFTNVTIPVKGSLFLIGDNGAGKTTVLDAIHVALTGDHGVELNAAARVSGRRDEGRDLAGILLRSQLETGPGRTSAVGYALLELRRGEEALSLGVGAWAASPESRVDRWGVFARRPLSDLPLVVDDRVLDRADLARRLKPGEVLDIGRYRGAVAQLFSGRDHFNEVALLLRAGKAYRELVARTASFSELFGELLPEPDVEAYGEVRRAIEGIDRIRADLVALEEERGRLADLVAACEQVDEAREALARYDWLRARFDHTAARGREERAKKDEVRVAAEHQEATRILAAEDAAREEAKGELLRLEASEGGALLRNLALNRAEEARRRDELSRRAEQRASCDAEVEEADGEVSAAGTALTRAAAAAGDCLASVQADTAAELPVAALDAAGRLADRLARATELEVDAAEARPLLEALRSGLRARRSELELGAHDARTESGRLKGEAAALREQAEGLRRRGEVEPPIAALEAAIARLAAAGIPARPVYRLVEPDGVGLDRLGFVERALGPEALGTLVVEPAAHEETLKILLDSAPGVPLAWPTVAATALSGLRVEDPTAAALLGRRLGDALAGSEAAFLTDAGQLHHAGIDVKLPPGPPRWLGEDARRAALETELSRIEAEARSLEARAAAAEAHAGELARRAAALGEAEERLSSLDLDAVLRFQLERRSAAARLSAARARREQAMREEELARSALVEVERAIAALERERDGAGLQALERRIRELRERIEQASARRDAASRRQAVAIAERDRLARELAEASVAVGEAARGLESARTVLLARVPAEVRADVESYVLRTKGGAQVKAENLPELRGRADRERWAAVTRIGGADGIRGPLLWQKYAFAYDEDENRLADQQGQPLEAVLARVQAEVGEVSGSLTSRQQELLERVVLEDLVGTLRSEVFGLEGTIRQINRQVSDLSFGGTRYRLEHTLRPEFKTLHELLRTASGLSPGAREELKAFFQSRLAELGSAEDGVPPLLDYRRWFEFHIRMSTTDDAGVELSPRRLRKGSGGEQAVPNYLLLLCLASVLYDRSSASLRLLLLDEAFYGIDAGRREELLRFSSRLGITLVVATPEMDGVTEAMKASTTLFLEKLPSGKVCLSDFVFENRPADLFGGGGLPDPEAMVVGAR